MEWLNKVGTSWEKFLLIYLHMGNGRPYVTHVERNKIDTGEHNKRSPTASHQFAVTRISVCDYCTFLETYPGDINFLTHNLQLCNSWYTNGYINIYIFMFVGDKHDFALLDMKHRFHVWPNTSISLNYLHHGSSTPIRATEGTYYWNTQFNCIYLCLKVLTCTHNRMKRPW